MIENEYGEAAVEVLDILNHTDKADVEKIPQSFINFLTDISSKNYKTEFDHQKSINEFNLNRKTREILGFIYITWWGSDSERQNYKKQIQQNSIIKREEPQFIYDYNQIFNYQNVSINSESITQGNMVEYKYENIFRKVVNKIFNFFGFKN